VIPAPAAPATRAASRGPAFVRDSRGTAAIEFAFIAPVLMVAYFGVVELSLAIEASRKVTSTASAIGDLVAQTKQINNTEVSAIFDVADAIMQPLDDGPMQLRITSITMDEDGDRKVEWSRARNISPIACGGSPTVAADVLTEGQSIIKAEVIYDYAPPIGRLLTGVIRMDDTFYMRPRESVEVTMLTSPCP
jgi:Flp pilus assembly protein TadG